MKATEQHFRVELFVIIIIIIIIIFTIIIICSVQPMNA